MYYKETPKRVVKSASGEIVYLVEWWCPECSGKGCKVCKYKGSMDGLERVYYDQITRWIPKKRTGKNKL